MRMLGHAARLYARCSYRRISTGRQRGRESRTWKRDEAPRWEPAERFDWDERFGYCACDGCLEDRDDWWAALDHW